MYQTYRNACNESILYEFQKQALAQALPSYFYCLDTGTGKTITSIHHYLKFSKGEKLLVFAPAQKVKEGGWTRDIQKVCDHYGISIPFEVVSYGMIAKTVIPDEPYFVIYDEAHYIKNPTSQRGKKAQLLAKRATQFVLLTATPMSNGWIDSYNYFIMFGCFRNKTDMNRQHAVFTDFNFGARVVKKITSWRNEDILNRYFERFSISISKDDALDLPPLITRAVTFKPSKSYRELKRNRVLNGELFDTVPKLMHGLRYHANQKDKLEYLEMLASGTNKNMIVFYQYQQEFVDISALMVSLEKQIFVVNGQRTELPNRSEWDQLKNSVTLVQYQSGSSGIELQYATEVVFYTPTYSYQDYEQSLGRAYRNGQSRKVTVYQFNTENTVEQDVWKALGSKKDFSEKIYAMTKLNK